MSKKRVSFALVATAASALVIFACTKSLTTTSKTSTVSSNGGQKLLTRSPSEGWQPNSNVTELNKIILAIHRVDDIDPSVDKILAFAELHKDDPAVGVYAMAASVLKTTNKDGVVIRPLRSLLWRMGGFAIQSEQIYTVVVSALRSAKYTHHLYSDAIDYLFDYMIFPPTNEKELALLPRFESVTDFQNYVDSILIPVVERTKKMGDDLLANNEYIDFLYDRALAVGPMEFASEKDQYSKFVKPYLKAGQVYLNNLLGWMHIVDAYNLDSLPDFYNEILYDSFKSTYLHADTFIPWLKRKGEKRFRNIKIHTPEDYKDFISKYSQTTRLFHLRTKEKDGHNGQADRDAALLYFAAAARLDVDYINDLQKLATLPNQGDYIIDHESFIHKPANKLERVEKIARYFEGPSEFADPLTGKTYRINVPRLFHADLNKDLSFYYPIETETHGNPKNEGHRITLVGKQELHSFWYDFGRPKKWKDPTFGGFLPDATNENLYDIQRAMQFSDDLDILGSQLLWLVI